MHCCIFVDVFLILFLDLFTSVNSFYSLICIFIQYLLLCYVRYMVTHRLWVPLAPHDPADSTGIPEASSSLVGFDPRNPLRRDLRVAFLKKKNVWPYQKTLLSLLLLFFFFNILISFGLTVLRGFLGLSKSKFVLFAMQQEQTPEQKISQDYDGFCFQKIESHSTRI